MTRSTLQVLAVAALFAAFTVSSASAAVIASPTTLDVLIADETNEIHSGDLKFYDFDHTNTGEATDPSNIAVTSVSKEIDGEELYGIRFNGSFGSLITKDNFISFMVMTLGDDAPSIDDVHIFGNPAALGDDSSSSGTVTIDGALQLTVFDFNVGDDEGTQLSDEDDLESTNMLGVTVDLEGQGVTAFSNLEIYFSRGDGPGDTPEIPTPAALPAGLALMMFAATRRRRNKA